ncbi:MAG: hypothetical protein LBI03_07795 [Clostridiales bacterium]|jgi:hypothetical protein|nr:hypothetical protein [Clostridiales bacterium]
MIIHADSKPDKIAVSERTEGKKMSTPNKKPNQTPESYSPQKPEILSMAEGQINTKNLTENILHGIPEMGYGNPSAVCYIGAVMRLMDYLNDPVEADELFSLSGVALCFPWKAGLCCDEISILPEIPQRTFTALGYESEYIYEPNVYIEPYSLTETRETINGQPKMTINPRKYSKEFYIGKIKSSIDSGRPVIGFGLTELNFTCLVTGYRNNGDGLNLRAYWSPQGEPEGYGGEDNYYYTEDWYGKCCGLVILGGKTCERLTGEQAYRYIQENAKLLYAKKTEYTQGEVFYNNAAAFGDMVQWLLDDDWWREGFDVHNREMYLKPVGLLLLKHYRSYLHSYLGRLYGQCPSIINPGIRPAIEQLGKNFPGANQGQLFLNECVDPAITDFSMLYDRSLREKVAAYVVKLEELDRKIFDCIMS